MEPIAVRAEEAARLLGISLRKLREMQRELPHIRAGGCILYPVDALRRWANERAQKER
jgi:excisionase family DNA binding protein